MALTKINDRSGYSVDLSSYATTSDLNNIDAGKVLQVVQATDYSTSTSTNVSSWYDLGTLSVAITPSSTSSKCMIMCSISYGTDTNTYGKGRIVRVVGGVTAAVARGPEDGVRWRSTFPLASNDAWTKPVVTSYQYLDSPATTSEITYKVQAAVPDGMIKLNTAGENENSFNTGIRAYSVIQVLEIAG